MWLAERPLPTFAVVVPDQPGLVLEVSFDGQVQSLDLETGVLDAGVAQALQPVASGWSMRGCCGD